MENKIDKILIILFIVISLGLISMTGYFVFKNYKNTKPTQNNQQSILEPSSSQEPVTKIYFVGDIMLARGVANSVNKNFGGDYNQLFKNIPELKEADILFGNLEGPISNLGNNVGSKYSFRMDPLVFDSLKNIGFDIFSFANNHVGDWNILAFQDTLSRLKEQNIFFTGAGNNKKEASSPAIVEKNGLRFGFIGFSDVGPNWMEAKEDKSGILLAKDPDYAKIITDAKGQVDVLIVSIHFGDEYKTIHNQRQEKLARLAVDSGADLVIGHHPHVIQDMEFYNGKTIIYSLGNFIFDQYFSKETMQGMVFMTTFEGKNIKDTKQMITIQNKKYQIEGLHEKEKAKDLSEILYSKCPKPDKNYDDMFLLNIGQKIGLPDPKYTPFNLVELDNLSTNKDYCLVQEAKRALEKMVNAAKEKSLMIKATSAFRNYSYQNNLYKNALLNIENPQTAVAKPGHSEHQLGTTVDLSGSTIGYSSANENFDNTKEELWLRNNAHKYGFILSYPEGKEDITGYKHESWHYRYLGNELAQKIKDSGLTITEYLK